MTKKDLLHDKVFLRQSTYEDIDGLVELSAVGFPGLDTFQPDHFKSHFEIFPEGQFCIEYDGKVIGSCSSMILNFDEFTDQATFDEVTSDGYITNHNPLGKNLYGVDVVVHPEYRGFSLGKRLYEARRKLCKDLNLESIVFGGRIPNYKNYVDKMKATDYVDKVLNEELYDPTFTFQLKQGFEYKKIIPGYLPSDHESLEYATLMVWKNPDYVNVEQ